MLMADNIYCIQFNIVEAYTDKRINNLKETNRIL